MTIVKRNSLFSFISVSTLEQVGGRILPRGRFARNVAVLAGGTALAQGLTVLASPILTRLYKPEDFGILAVYASILSILLVVASWRYEMAIPLPEDEVIAANLMALALLVLLGMSFATGVGVWLFSNDIMLWPNASPLGVYLWLLPISLFGAGGYQILNYWAVRKGSFARIARTKLNQSIGSIITQLSLGLLHFGPLGLLAGQMIGQASGTMTLAKLARRKDSEALKKISFSGIRWAANRYRRFPMITSGSAVLNSLGLQAPVLLLTAFYGPQVVGWFAFAQRVTSMPLNLVGQSLAQVYFGEAAQLAREDPRRLRMRFLGISRRLLLIGAGPVIFLGLAGEQLFSLIFGNQWQEAGLYVQLMAVMFLAQFIATPLSQTFSALERQDLGLAWSAGRLIAVVFSIFLAHWFQLTLSWVIAIYALAMFITYCILFVMSLLAISSHIRLSDHLVAKRGGRV
ncbi:MAG: oligosaccharide flippase family protein [Actinobacteria bacterium]|nr:oligosaccharide flippase family protein [Actinomycetota bacterium]